MIECALAAVLATQAPPQGQDLLDDMSRRAVSFFYQQSNLQTGFTKDRAANLTNSDTYTVSSVASTGFALAAYAVGSERGWLSRAAALGRARTTANALRTKHAKYRGWFYHFVDWQSGARVWNCELSSIDTSILLSGLIVAQQYFNDPQLTADADAILSEVDWESMLRNGGNLPGSYTFCMGWTPENGWITSRWDSYSEQLMLLIQALGSWKECPALVWDAIQRPTFQYSGIEFLSGGPLFMHQMSHGFLDFNKRRDRLGYDYWVASRRATLANRQYCINNPHNKPAYGPNYWGLTACDGPNGYTVNGAPVWGSDDGTIAPTCVAASIDYLPTEVMSTLNSLRTTYPGGYGRYGFSNGINAGQNWMGPDVIGIDLGMAMCAIENRRDGFIHRMSAKSPIVRTGFRRAELTAQRRNSSEQDILRITR